MDDDATPPSSNTHAEDDSLTSIENNADNLDKDLDQLMEEVEGVLDDDTNETNPAQDNLNKALSAPSHKAKKDMLKAQAALKAQKRQKKKDKAQQIKTKQTSKNITVIDSSSSDDASQDSRTDDDASSSSDDSTSHKKKTPASKSSKAKSTRTSN